jgi:hypothetical protein
LLLPELRRLTVLLLRPSLFIAHNLVHLMLPHNRHNITNTHRLLVATLFLLVRAAPRKITLPAPEVIMQGRKVAHLNPSLPTSSK